MLRVRDHFELRIGDCRAEPLGERARQPKRARRRAAADPPIPGPTTITLGLIAGASDRAAIAWPGA
jgi:hypothetical protein